MHNLASIEKRVKSMRDVLEERDMDLSTLREAAHSTEAVEGLTHGFYRYPARFSPDFAAEAIRCFSKPGELVLDPFMGGGTTVVEAMAAGRRAVGCDINSLAVFITRVKTTPLPAAESELICDWVNRVAGQLDYRASIPGLAPILLDRRTRNLSLPRARALKKALAIALETVTQFPTRRSQDFARCVLLKTAQWALDNRKRSTPLNEFRKRLVENSADMLAAMREFSRIVRRHRYGGTARLLLETDAAAIDTAPIFQESKEKVDLVVASPPYPGIHVLYDRWQVDGRRETPAPYSTEKTAKLVCQTAV